MIERASPNDLMELAADVGPVPMHIAGVLVLEAGPGFDLDAAARLVRQRLGGVPRLRQRLVPAPPGCGRAHWVDDPGLDPDRHVSLVPCQAPGDEAALLDTALTLAGRTMPRSAPLWSAALVSGLQGGRVAVVVVLHHVVADGVGGLAVLGSLVDGGPAADRGRPQPRPAPTPRELATEAWASRLRSPRRLPARARQLPSALAELGASRPVRAPLTSLTRVTGTRRRARVSRVDLAGVRAGARRDGATVNDVLLAAVGGALGALLAARGEQVPELVVSVPVSARPAAGAKDLGNQVGVIPVPVPTTGDARSRLVRVAAATRARRTAARGSSAVLLQPAFRASAALGVFGWLINRQRRVNTFVTNLRGPSEPVTVSSARVSEVVPLSGTYGNVPVAFTALSYAGTLTVTVLVDPEVVPELPMLTAALQHELEILAAPDPVGG